MQKLKEWTKSHLSEDMFFEEFKNKEFKRKLNERSLLASSTMEGDQTKIMNATTFEMKANSFTEDGSLPLSQIFQEIKVTILLIKFHF